MDRLLLAAGRIGESDCETIGGGLLAQPVNAISSLAYVVVAGWLVWWTRRLAGPERAMAGIYAVVLALVGFGSVAFHGPMPSWAKLAHDLPIAAIGLIVAMVALIRTDPDRRGAVAVAVAVAVVGVGILFAIVPGAGLTTTGTIAVGAIAAEGLRWRRERLWRRHVVVRRYVGAAGILIIAAVINALGKTGGPWCRPDAWIQPHALWHILSAVAFGSLAAGLFAPTEAGRPAQ